MTRIRSVIMPPEIEHPGPAVAYGARSIRHLPPNKPGKAIGAACKNRLRCPEIRPESIATSLESLDLDALRTVAQLYASGRATFGLELKVANQLEISDPLASTPRRIERSYYRLAQEPIIWSYWEPLKEDRPDCDEMLAFASVLNGQAVQYRSGEMFACAENGGPAVYYEAPTDSRGWLTDVARADGLTGDPVKRAIYCFARVLTAHPFIDANGRFARALLQARLARHGLIESPCLALGPVMHAHEYAMHDNLGRLCSSGDWQEFFEFMGGILNIAIRHVQAVVNEERQAWR